MYVILGSVEVRDVKKDILLLVLSLIVSVTLASISIYVIFMKYKTSMKEKLESEEYEMLIQKDSQGNVVEKLVCVKESVIVPKKHRKLYTKSPANPPNRISTRLEQTSIRDRVFVQSTGDIPSDPYAGRGMQLTVPAGATRGARSDGNPGQRFGPATQRHRSGYDIDRVAASFTSLADSYQGRVRAQQRASSLSTTHSAIHQSVSSAGILNLAAVAAPLPPPPSSTNQNSPPSIHVIVPRRSADVQSRTVSYGTAMAQLHGIRGGLVSSVTCATGQDVVGITDTSLQTNGAGAGAGQRDPKTSYDPNAVSDIYRRRSPYERVSSRKHRPLGSRETSRHREVASSSSPHGVANVTRLSVPHLEHGHLPVLEHEHPLERGGRRAAQPEIGESRVHAQQIRDRRGITELRELQEFIRREMGGNQDDSDG